MISRKEHFATAALLIAGSMFVFHAQNVHAQKAQCAKGAFGATRFFAPAPACSKCKRATSRPACSSPCKGSSNFNFSGCNGFATQLLSHHKNHRTEMSPDTAWFRE